MRPLLHVSLRFDFSPYTHSGPATEDLEPEAAAESRGLLQQDPRSAAEIVERQSLLQQAAHPAPEMVQARQSEGQRSDRPSVVPVRSDGAGSSPAMHLASVPHVTIGGRPLGHSEDGRGTAEAHTLRPSASSSAIGQANEGSRGEHDALGINAESSIQGQQLEGGRAGPSSSSSSLIAGKRMRRVWIPLD